VAGGSVLACLARPLASAHGGVPGPTGGGAATGADRARARRPGTGRQVRGAAVVADGAAKSARPDAVAFAPARALRYPAARARKLVQSTGRGEHLVDRPRDRLTRA